MENISYTYGDFWFEVFWFWTSYAANFILKAGNIGDAFILKLDLRQSQSEWTKIKSSARFLIIPPWLNQNNEQDQGIAHCYSVIVILQLWKKYR